MTIKNHIEKRIKKKLNHIEKNIIKNTILKL